MNNSPATLTAIAYAAHKSADHELKREAVRRLRDEFGIALRFTKPAEKQRLGVQR